MSWICLICGFVLDLLDIWVCFGFVGYVAFGYLGVLNVFDMWVCFSFVRCRFLIYWCVLDLLDELVCFGFVEYVGMDILDTLVRSYYMHYVYLTFEYVGLNLIFVLKFLSFLNTNS